MDSSLVTGTITDTEGKFHATKIAEGKYYIKVNFLGYEELHLSEIVIDERNSRLNIGEVTMEASTQLLEEVVITTERNAVEFQIDKKVISKIPLDPGGCGGQCITSRKHGFYRSDRWKTHRAGSQ